MNMLHQIRLAFQGNLQFSTFLGRESTIYALATGGIRCAVAVIRVSGPETSTVLKKIGNFSKLPEPRRAVLRKLHDPEVAIWNRNSIIDHGIVLWFPGPSSYSGEDSCEFQIHGGPAVVTALLRSIGTFPNCRVAEPGEFTKRAFLNGKMDFTEIDGLADLISAETEMQRLQALNQMSGSLGRLYESWRDRIAKSLANAEAYIDFGEDENIEHNILETIEKEVRSIIAEIKLHLGDTRKGERLRDGVQVAIIGKPNVGKSSLLNLLCASQLTTIHELGPVPLEGLYQGQWQRFEQRDLGPKDVHIKVLACGICHSDVHQARSEWGDNSIYPMVPGHEMVGIVQAVGKDVTKVKKGDKAAVGVFVDSCRTCVQCKKGSEQYCSKRVPSYNGRLLKDNSPTYGGYARDVVCEDAFVLRFPDNLDVFAGAPLLCAGITVYSPMKKYGMDAKGKKIGVIGLGGLGHMAVKFGVAFGNEVTVISRSESKRKEATTELGAKHFINSSDVAQVKAAAGTLDFIVDTVSADKDMNLYMSLLDVDGVFVTVGLPPAGVSLSISPGSLINFRKSIVGSVVGSIKETQEMLEYCALKNITSTIEKVPLEYANTAWDRMTKSDVHYRFVLDIEKSAQ